MNFLQNPIPTGLIFWIGGEKVVYISDAEVKPSPEELLHFGVKGMRWGVRRSDKELGQSSAKKKTSSKRKVTKRKVAAVGVGGLAVAGAAAAGWVIGNAAGTKLADLKFARTMELGQATIDKGLFDMVRNHDMNTIDAQMASYIVRDTFKNRV
jgi:hypothetical protein